MQMLGPTSTLTNVAPGKFWECPTCKLRVTPPAEALEFDILREQREHLRTCRPKR